MIPSKIQLQNGCPACGRVFNPPNDWHQGHEVTVTCDCGAEVACVFSVDSPVGRSHDAKMARPEDPLPVPLERSH